MKKNNLMELKPTANGIAEALNQINAFISFKGDETSGQKPFEYYLKPGYGVIPKIDELTRGVQLYQSLGDEETKKSEEPRIFNIFGNRIEVPIAWSYYEDYDKNNKPVLKKFKSIDFKPEMIEDVLVSYIDAHKLVLLLQNYLSYMLRGFAVSSKDLSASELGDAKNRFGENFLNLWTGTVPNNASPAAREDILAKSNALHIISGLFKSQLEGEITDMEKILKVIRADHLVDVDDIDIDDTPFSTPIVENNTAVYNTTYLNQGRESNSDNLVLGLSSLGGSNPSNAKK